MTNLPRWSGGLAGCDGIPRTRGGATGGNEMRRALRALVVATNAAQPHAPARPGHPLRFAVAPDPTVHNADSTLVPV